MVVSFVYGDPSLNIAMAFSVGKQNRLMESLTPKKQLDLQKGVDQRKETKAKRKRRNATMMMTMRLISLDIDEIDESQAQRPPFST